MVNYHAFFWVSSNFIFLGNSITEEDVKEMLFSADVDGDGLINYEEFLKVMVSLNTFFLYISLSKLPILDPLQGEWSIFILNLIHTS